MLKISEKYLLTKDVQNILGVGKSRVIEMTAKGQLKFFTAGQQRPIRIYRKAEVLRVKEQRQQEL